MDKRSVSVSVSPLLQSTLAGYDEVSLSGERAGENVVIVEIASDRHR
jgi:hypothetical protein